jgi:hypothetical protein
LSENPGATVVVDRGMAFDENLAQIRKRGLHYLVAGRQPERNQWLDEFEDDADWEEIVRTPSPRKPGQVKTRVEVKRRQKGDHVYVLCRSNGRLNKARPFEKSTKPGGWAIWASSSSAWRRGA